MHADKRRSEEPFIDSGNKLLLSTKNLTLKNPSSKKLLPLRVGPSDIIGRVAYKLQLKVIAGKLEYKIEQVLSYDGCRKRYLVKWLGYGHENNTLEPEKNLENSSELIQEYWDLSS